MKLKQSGTGSGGAFAWFFQRITGLILVLTLLLHYLFLHFFNHGIVTYQEVAARLATPFWKTVDLLFLVSVIYHAVQGILMVIHDYVHHPGIRITLIGLTWFLGIVLLITGTTTIINFRL